MQQHLERVLAAGVGQRLRRLGQGIAGADQGPGIDLTAVQGGNGRGKRPAAGADHPQFVDDDPRQIETGWLGRGGFEDQHAARAQVFEDIGASLGPAGGVDGEIQRQTGGEGGGGAQAQGLGNRQLARVPPDQQGIVSRGPQHLRAELAQPPIAEHRGPLARVRGQVAQDGKGCRGRLGEDRDLVEQVRGQGVQQGDGAEEILGEDAIPGVHAQDAALLAMGGQAGPAVGAGSAGGVDLSHHAAAHPIGMIRRRRYLGHIFMSQDAAKAGFVAGSHGQVGAADAGQPQAQQRLARGGDGTGRIGQEQGVPLLQG